MEELGIVAGLLVVANLMFTYQAFRYPAVFKGNLLEVDKIVEGKEYKRVFTSGFIHTNWLHLMLNMTALLAFSVGVESGLSSENFIMIYLGSLLGGNLLALFIHRYHGHYQLLGASGAVSGIIFSTIVLSPSVTVSSFLIPVEIPGWILGVAFVLASLMANRSTYGKMGHEAPLGGVIAGVMLTALIEPSILQTHPWVIAAILIPIFAFLYILVCHSAWLTMSAFTSPPKTHVRRKMVARKNPQQEMDELLDKISQHGYESLSRAEKTRLQQISKKLIERN